jgi:hypothetical protein
MAEHLPVGLRDLYRRLLLADMQRRLPGKDGDHQDRISEEDLARLLGGASALALSESADDRTAAYEIATRTVSLRDGLSPSLLKTTDILLSRLGNFPGRQLLRDRYGEAFMDQPVAPYLQLEVLAREVENTVADRAGGTRPLTDFQVGTLDAFNEASAVSVSAPTSAGKSFVLSLEVIRKLLEQPQAAVAYVVPTRALIRQVVLTLRRDLRKSGLAHIPLRSIPTPIAREAAPD